LDFAQLSQVLSPELRAAALLMALIFVLGRIPILKFVILPFSVFGVIVHEMAHAVTLWLSGGSFRDIIVEFNPTTNEVTGATRNPRGNIVFSANAGYLGTIAFGALLLVIANSSVSARLVLLVLGGATALVTLLYIRNRFGVVSGLLIAVAMVAISRQFPEVIAKGVLWIAAATMFVDSALHLIGTPGDSKLLERTTGINFGFWIVLWQILAVVILLYALNRAYGVPLPWTLIGRAQ
jgi:hypothetical protein